jgi:hypothetical protein
MLFKTEILKDDVLLGYVSSTLSKVVQTNIYLTSI